MGEWSDALGRTGAEIDVRVSSLMGEATAANQRVAELEHENSELSNSLSATQAEKLALESQLRKARARANRFERLYRECSGSDTEMVVGSSCGAHTYDYFTQMAGSPLRARRSYDNVRSSLVSSVKADEANDCVSVNSMASNPANIFNELDEIESYLMDVSHAHRFKFIKSHEPENPKKGYLPGQYITQQVEVRKVVDKVNLTRPADNPIEFWGNWMAWSVRAAANRDMNKWRPPAGTWDGLSWDGYSSNTISVAPASEIFGDALLYCQQNNLRFAIGETGIHRAHFHETRAKWIDDCQMWAADQDASFYLYWDGADYVDPDYQLATALEFKAVVEGP